ncbi:hypothetical protein M404DRAFT_884661 [Pisolithus tinctorius Marx 270]|uniref:Uncharacterized protein n=1 Tax=Pisolithus tinctorius Marx 270 TaxID=870435 RepID=A0A0C3NR83_PISTI|nr:hypothetical protein M404DRAFT_884661 [Pisolithus tinctorius Marx 270]
MYSQWSYTPLSGPCDAFLLHAVSEQTQCSGFKPTPFRFPLTLTAQQGYHILGPELGAGPGGFCLNSKPIYNEI